MCPLSFFQHITDPHIASASLDVAINNPLSQAEDVREHCQVFLSLLLRLNFVCGGHFEKSV